MASAGRWAWIAEVAGEELAKLEAAHPGRFGWLRADLERLIADPGQLDEAANNLSSLPLVSPHAGAGAADTTPAASYSQLQPADDAAPSRTVVPVCTQESSTRIKRKPRGGVRDREKGKRTRRPSTPPGSGGAKDSADMAIERAQRCLERIREFKQSLLAAGWKPRDAREKREHPQECGRRSAN